MKSSTKESVLKAAAKIIKTEISDVNVSKTHYPNAEDILDESKCRKWIHESLSIFLSQLVRSNVKQMYISQCIDQTARPRTVITPLLFGLGVLWIKHLDQNGSSTGISQSLGNKPDEVTRSKQTATEKMDAVS